MLETKRGVMKITNLVVKPLSWALNPPLSNPVMTWTKKEIVLVFIETDSGMTGVGEGWVSGGTAIALTATLEQDVTPILIGRNPLKISGIWEDLDYSRSISARPGIIRAAMSAVDIALWDLLGQFSGLPLYQLIGGHSDHANVYASAGLYGENKSLDMLVEEMSGYVEKGFNAVKMKVGGASISKDIERVRAVREAIGPDIRLMVDAVCGLKTTAALKLAEAIKPFDIYFFEQPVASQNLEGMALVNDKGGIPVAGNENYVDLTQFYELLLKKSVSFTQFDLAVCGGITEGLRIDSIARACFSPTTIHSAGSIICMAASLHIAAGLSNCESVEFHMLHQWLFEHAPPGFFNIQESCIYLPDTPGLGIQLNLRTL